ncbi:MAG: glycosyltransferase family 9 protein [Candidatus Omnitrophota bacterium]
MRLNNIHKILFITLSNIGDVILTLPVLTCLKDNFKDASIDIVLGPRPKDIFKKDPLVNKVIVYDKHSSLKDKVGFIKDLRKEKYDLAVDMRSSLIPFLIGARYKTCIFSKRSPSRHKRQAHLEKLKDFDLYCKVGKNIHVAKEDREKIERILKESGIDSGSLLIGMSPSCLSLTKEWEKDYFIEIIKEILKRTDAKVVLIGEESKKSVSEHIVKGVNSTNIIDLTGKTNINELFAIVERFNVLLTCDNASMHIASDLGIKVVSIFGPTDPEEYGPTGNDDVVFQKKLSCVPCKKALCRFDHECMKAIKPAEVLEAVERLVFSC